MSLKALIQSHRNFVEKHQKKYHEIFQELVEKGQSPKTLFIGCSDSRVVPTLITQTDPGELFVLRNVGNFVPPFKPDSDFHGTAAGIEYAVSVLEVENIIVCGHTHCGACEHLFHEVPDDEAFMHIKNWLHIAKSAKQQAEALCESEREGDKLYRATEKFNIIEQLSHLFSYPAIQKKALEGHLTVQGWYYDIGSGEIACFNPESYVFEPLVSQVAV